MAWFIRWHC